MPFHSFCSTLCTRFPISFPFPSICSVSFLLRSWCKNSSAFRYLFYVFSSLLIKSLIRFLYVYTNSAANRLKLQHLISYRYFWISIFNIYVQVLLSFISYFWFSFSFGFCVFGVRSIYFYIYSYIFFSYYRYKRIYMYVYTVSSAFRCERKKKTQFTLKLIGTLYGCLYFILYQFISFTSNTIRISRETKPTLVISLHSSPFFCLVSLVSLVSFFSWFSLSCV